MRDDLLWTLALVFIPFSLLSIGGGSSIISGIEREVVGHHRWLTSREFVDIFAISRAAPGPGSMLATLVGWKIAGWAGAVVATLALFVPSSILCYGIFRLSNRHREKRWHRAMREGLAPVGTGLIIAGVISIIRISGGGPLALLMAGAAATVLLRFPKFPTVALLMLGGVVTAAIHLWAHM